MTEIFTLAVAGAPFGLKGFVKVWSLSEETSHLAALKSIKLRQENTEKVYSIEKIIAPGAAGHPGGTDFVLMKFAGIDSPEVAKTLKGAELIADRSQASPLGKDEFYVEDLKGLTVITGNSAKNQETIGQIIDIIEGGGGQLAEIRLISGEAKLVPFRDEFFGAIDLEKSQAILLETWILE